MAANFEGEVEFVINERTGEKISLRKSLRNMEVKKVAAKANMDARKASRVSNLQYKVF